MSDNINNQSVKTIAISASFTDEPLEESLDFWGRELQNPFSIEFAPYNQVFQQLLDPSSLLSQNKLGMNVILIRFEDWKRHDKKLVSKPDIHEKIKENVNSLILALKSALERSATPYLVYVCPASPRTVADAEEMKFHQKMEELIASKLDIIGNLYLVKASELVRPYSVTNYYDAYTDEVGHVPYTPAFFAALGTSIARKYIAIQSTPYKVIVLDCDQTLWKGVCGEDGPLGVEIDTPRKLLQEFMVRQHDAGKLICLCSKNNEEDVIRVFEHHPEMPLKRDNIVSWRINWRPKSENIKSLADELQLGLDSFIFIDDNPVECAEIRANCPDVLTLCLPQPSDNIPEFLDHTWCFDYLKITGEDKKRTALYQQNIKRDQFLQKSLTLQDFLVGLGMEVRISEPASQHLTRVAQLTQRTNQFNFTTIRRSEAEIQNLLRAGDLKCLITEVSDRFGDYGLVGVTLYNTNSEALKVDTFLLSCRVLGRGVEHRILARLGNIAREHGLDHIEVSYFPTKKNQPALDFLDKVGSNYKQQVNGAFVYKFPAEYANAITYIPDRGKETMANEADSLSSSRPQTTGVQVAYTQAKSEVFQHIAFNLCNAEKILKAIESQPYRQRPELTGKYIAPHSELECSIAGIWQKVLGIEKVGIHDDFFEIGGNSLKAVRIFAQIDKMYSKKLPLATLYKAPTIKQLASIISDDKWIASWDSLIEIQPGDSAPPLFLIHAGGGNALIYHDLAHHLGSERPIYGVQSQGLDGKQPFLTRTEDMAACYIKEIQTIQPEGPYLLGGFCMGGMIALEMALQLQAQKQEVALLLFMETYNLGNMPSRSFLDDIYYYLQKIEFNWGRLFSGERNFLRRRGDLIKARAAVFFEVFKSKLGKHQTGNGRYISLQELEKTNDWVAQHYVPGAAYHGRIVQFVPAKEYARLNHPESGWEKMAVGGLETYKLPLYPRQMLVEPFVTLLAANLKACVDRALESKLSR